MKKSTHLPYYSSLGGILLIGILLIMYFSPNRDSQFLVVVGMGICYTLLGLIHHHLAHDLVLKIVVEYILIATLGVSLIYFVLRGGFGF